MLASIIIPVYNAAKYIEDTLESTLNQSISDFEVVLVDDCSTDNTADICKSFCKKDNRCRYVKLDKNSGPAAARNRGIREAQGDYLLFVDSDDFVSPDFVKILTQTAINNSADVVWCNFEYYYDSTSIRLTANHNLRGFLESEDFLKCFCSNETIDGLGSMCNKVYLREYILDHEHKIDENRVYGEDWDFNFRLAQTFPRVYATPVVLYTYMKRRGISVSKKYHKCDFDSYQSNYSIVKKLSKTYKLDDGSEGKRENNHVYNIVSLLYKLCHSDLSKVEKQLEYRRITRDGLFIEILYSTPILNPALTLRQKVTTFLLRIKLYNFAWLTLKL